MSFDLRLPRPGQPISRCTSSGIWGAPLVRKVEIANRTFEELGITKEKAKDTVNGILDEVKQAMFEGESV